MITDWGTVQTSKFKSSKVQKFKSSKFKVLSLGVNYLYKITGDKARKTSKNTRFKRSCKCFVIRLL